MALSQADCIAAITEHSEGFASAARGRLDAEVEHCPGWSVADLVAHVIEVHWFWATVVEERLLDRPTEDRKSTRVPDDDLVATFEAGADRLVRVLNAARPGDRVWTWAPAHQHAGFVVRHQVQEIAVHHWDAAHAAGGSLVIGAEAAADAVEEFLTVSISTADDPADPPRAALDGAVQLVITDTGDTRLVEDGAEPGTVRVTRAGDSDAPTPAPTLRATASDLLLWLYGRITLDTSAINAELLARLRALTFTD